MNLVWDAQSYLERIRNLQNSNSAEEYRICYFRTMSASQICVSSTSNRHYSFLKLVMKFFTNQCIEIFFSIMRNCSLIKKIVEEDFTENDQSSNYKPS